MSVSNYQPDVAFVQLHFEEIQVNHINEERLESDLGYRFRVPGGVHADLVLKRAPPFMRQRLRLLLSFRRW